MKTLFHQLEHYLLRSNSWVFLTVVLLLSHWLVSDLPQAGWSDFLPGLALTTLPALPVLLFSIYRSTLYRWSRRGYVVLWIICFLVFPIALYLGRPFPFSPLFDSGHALVVGRWLLFAEVILLLNHYWWEKNRPVRLLQRLRLEPAIVLVLALVAFSLSGLELMGEQIFDPRPGTTAPTTQAGMVGAFLGHGLQYLLILLLLYGFYYINHYLLITKLLRQRGIIYYAFALIGTVLLLYPMAAQLMAWLPMVRLETTHPVTEGRIFDNVNLIVPFFGMLLSIPFILMVQWYKQGQAISTLEKDRAEAELISLKQQINPHFFFNTLNNLYALSLTKDQATPEVIMQLSELMRYVIYRGKEKTVALAEEIKYIEDYIYLQRIRLHQQLEVKFEKNIADDRLNIPPLLFIPFVENAFKHGIEPAEKAAYLHLKIKTDDRRLIFTCENSVEARPEAAAPGIGLTNLERRLSLLFPNRYELRTQVLDDRYFAALQIDLG